MRAYGLRSYSLLVKVWVTCIQHICFGKIQDTLADRGGVGEEDPPQKRDIGLYRDIGVVLDVVVSNSKTRCFASVARNWAFWI